MHLNNSIPSSDIPSMPDENVAKETKDLGACDGNRARNLHRRGLLNPTESMSRLSICTLAAGGGGGTIILNRLTYRTLSRVT